MFVSYLNSVS